jgi:hypothetical protein
MKNIFLLLAVTSCFVNINAQKQEKDNLTIEMELSPLGSEPLKINGIRMRKFISDNTALRMSVFLGGKRTPSTTTSGNVDLTNISSNLDFSLRPGYEKHFDGTSKLSPYVGAELFFGVGTTNSTSENLWGSDQIMTTKNLGRQMSLGLNIVSGTDFYFSDKVYLGIEMGFGFLRDGRGINLVKYKNPDDPTLVDTKTKGNSTNLNWGPNYQGTIRIGYCIK